MSGYFGYHFAAPNSSNEASIRTALLFCAALKPSESEVISQVRDVITRCPTADSLILLGFEFNIEKLHQISETEILKERIPPTLRDPGKIPVRCIFFNRNGELVEFKNEKPIAATESDRIQRSGFAHLCVKYQAVLKATETYHYVKPSETHCDTFIRAAELLVRGGEIDWVAAWLLRYCPGKIEFVHCDTSSISVVAYSLVRVRRDLGFVDDPEILSYGSFSGLKDYSCPSSDAGVYIISASTAGKLVNELVEKGAVSYRVVTLFYLSPIKSKGHIVCNLEKDGASKRGDEFGYDHVKEYSETSCPFCAKGSARIYMRGEQFLPQHQNVKTITLAGADAPNWLAPLMKRALSRDLFRVHTGRAKRSQPHEIFCDVAGLLDEKGFKESLENILNRSLPANLAQIVHLDDRASEEMALRASKMFSDHVTREVPVISFRELSSNVDEHIITSGCTMVIASCIASGRSLMELSQILRVVQRGGLIVFIIGLTRMNSRDELREVKSNITHTPNPARRFGYNRIEEIFPPDYSGVRTSIWSAEINLLRNLREAYPEMDPQTLKFISDRSENFRIAEGISAGGLRDAIFLPSVSGQELQLRPNFAFFPFRYEPSAVKQSDVYFTVACVLHNLRSTKGEKCLCQYEYQRTLIHPHTFYRLNDGVIQAALLRAALAAELDYRVETNLSASMAEVLRFIFEGISSDRGEASIEFAMALALGQLRLAKADEESVINLFRSKVSENTFPWYLGEWLAAKL